MALLPSTGPPRSQRIARIVAGVGMAFAGTSHLTFARDGFKDQVPPWVPMDADDVVLLSGTVEIALGAGMLVLPKERRRMAGLLFAFLVAVFPGNIAQHRHHRDGLGLDSDTKRLVRLLTEPLMWLTALHAGGLLSSRKASRKQLPLEGPAQRKGEADQEGRAA